ncbi:MAG: hypothetical protein JRE64_24380 [Deltaproteobacteria bacterium]|nr:hypothetical protein [Deltaproteobacteria bacterium]
MKFKNLAIFCAVIVCIFALSGCLEPVKVTGGGTIESEAGDDCKANFGFVAIPDDDDSTFCITEYKGKFNYNDQCAGVKLSGDVKWASLLFGTFGGTYRSTNPQEPGEGEWFALAQDNGEGINESLDGDDEIAITILTGPYAGYYIEGYVQGNIQEH